MLIFAQPRCTVRQKNLPRFHADRCGDRPTQLVFVGLQRPNGQTGLPGGLNHQGLRGHFLDAHILGAVLPVHPLDLRDQVRALEPFPLKIQQDQVLFRADCPGGDDGIIGLFFQAEREVNRTEDATVFPRNKSIRNLEEIGSFRLPVAEPAPLETAAVGWLGSALVQALNQ